MYNIYIYIYSVNTLYVSVHLSLPSGFIMTGVNPGGATESNDVKT